MPKKIDPEEDVLELADPFEIFDAGPLYPFDYCWLTGMKKGLILEVQMELIHRNRNLVVVDRSPLGVDPNAALSRCYLAFGNPYDRVTVFNFYENDICRGVPLDYFSRVAVTRRIDLIYKENGWATGSYLTKAAESWRSEYNKALAALGDKILDIEDKLELSDLLDKYALWLIPMLHFASKPELLTKFATDRVRKLKDYWRELLSDYMILSTVNRTTFCVLSSTEEIYFKDTYLGKKEMIEQNSELFVFKPFLLKTSAILFVIALIVWTSSVQTGSGSSSGGVVIATILTAVPLSIFLMNFVFWMFFTSGSERFIKKVPPNWLSPIKKIPGYLK